MEMVYIIHKVRLGKPEIRTKKSWEGSKMYASREGWRLARKEEIAAHYKIEEKKPKKTKEVKPVENPVVDKP